jgi:hypothetical protein
MAVARLCALRTSIRKLARRSCAIPRLRTGSSARHPGHRDAPVEEFEQIAPQVPVFRVTAEQAAGHAAG